MTKTKTGYKLFRFNNGNLYPLYVTNKMTPIGVWIEAEEGPRTADGKVKSKLGPLAFRPGWHIADLPNSPWIGKRVNGGKLVRRKEHVWCEVEYHTDINYQPEADDNGWKAGKWAANRAYLKHIPFGGYYKYRTNPNGDIWVIAGEIKVNRILTDEEVRQICLKHGVIPQLIEKGA